MTSESFFDYDGFWRKIVLYYSPDKCRFVISRLIPISPDIGLGQYIMVIFQGIEKTLI